ncbi:MAG TPA: ABC transporter ATP-binding protein [Candidatus Corynebacterium gallistercoris]|uniref:ABC transporter ATP-binding protein n=1 Tax=Candidatus Corynebacterium gallistercoris TaxID=2838530 RepID=A0A9D1RWI9_9CORY|nr:ABC transporter ATP-binding protein [Candidatus Corynebacterium gallistercoris]
MNTPNTGTHTAPTNTAAQPAPGFELRGVTKKFGRHAAIDGATATLPGSTVYGLIGRNGAGKTTLLRAMAGQIHHTGEILVAGQPVFDNADVLGQLILAGPDVPWPETKVKHLIRIAAARWPNWSQDLADQLIADFQLDTRKTLNELSRGQRSIASIVIGLAAQAPVTLLDEPYLGLDVQNRQLFYRHLLADVEANPRTIILSTHHIEDAAKILDSVILIDSGRITGVGSLEEITQRIVTLSGSSAAVGSLVTRLGCSSSLLGDATSAGARRVTVDLATLPGLAAEGAGAPKVPMTLERLRGLAEGTGVRVQACDLEQAVLALTGRDFHALPADRKEDAS